MIANLGTKDPKAAKRLAPARLGELQAKIAAAQATLDRKTATLSDRDVLALAGEFYRGKVREAGDHAGQWQSVVGHRDLLGSGWCLATPP